MIDRDHVGEFEDRTAEEETHEEVPNGENARRTSELSKAVAEMKPNLHMDSIHSVCSVYCITEGNGVWPTVKEILIGGSDLFKILVKSRRIARWRMIRQLIRRAPMDLG
jgi:hypothetical protein